MHSKTLAQLIFCGIALLFLPHCASGGPQRYQSFFQAVELARSADAQSAQEALVSACSQSSSAACDAIGRDTKPADRVPILQGATIDTYTEVVLLLDTKATYQVFLWEKTAGKLIEAVETVPTDVPGGASRLVQLRYDGLSPVARYRLQVVGPAGELVDGRDLATLDTAKKRVHFAVASCMESKHPLQAQMWTELLSQEPELLFLIGDNVYADSEAPGAVTPPEVLWRRHLETRKELALFKAPKLIPILSVWDDHDFGKNDGDRTYPYRAESKKIYQAFFGRSEYPGIFDRGPGVASRLSAFGQRFFLLDARSFRSPVVDKKNQTHFGVDQEAWLFTDLYSQVPSWLLSGDQFFGAYHTFESFEGRHPESFRRFIRRLKVQTSPAIFVSGDRHLAEMMEIPADVLGYRSYEITSSSIHAAVYPDAFKRTPNPRQVEGAAGVNNYVLIEAEAGTTLQATVRAYGPDRRRLFTRSFEVAR